jgi:2-amino-4-hydroxy-6-hydroxymethyldihydropteridine diphosphokinase
LNQVLLFSSPHNPWFLLDLCKAWERVEGRVPSPLNAPRPIDVDLLAFEGVTVTSPRLTLPHPRLGGRLFLLPLLKEIPSVAKVLGWVLHPQEPGKWLVL